MTQEGLFEEPERVQLRKGDKVVVIAMDGDHRGKVDQVTKVNGYPMVVVKTYDGEVITINRAHVIVDPEE